MSRVSADDARLSRPSRVSRGYIEDVSELGSVAMSKVRRTETSDRRTRHFDCDVLPVQQRAVVIEVKANERGEAVTKDSAVESVSESEDGNERRNNSCSLHHISILSKHRLVP